MTTAETIFRQLGDNRARAMVGMQNILDLGDGLSFRFQGSGTANYCAIRLSADDTYAVRFCRIRRNGTVTEAGTSEGLFAEDLRAHFERTTGLLLSLGSLGAEVR